METQIKITTDKSNNKQNIFYKCIFDTKTNNGWICMDSNNHIFYLPIILPKKLKFEVIE